MEPTDTGIPDYYHRVVDCQWACPAHTDVPEYIRLIVQGKYTESYLLNRESNVFPGILGRVCDRPCEPACRRRRIEDLRWQTESLCCATAKWLAMFDGMKRPSTRLSSSLPV